MFNISVINSSLYLVDVPLKYAKSPTKQTRLYTPSVNLSLSLDHEVDTPGFFSTPVTLSGPRFLLVDFPMGQCTNWVTQQIQDSDFQTNLDQFRPMTNSKSQKHAVESVSVSVIPPVQHGVLTFEQKSDLYQPAKVWKKHKEQHSDWALKGGWPNAKTSQNMLLKGPHLRFWWSMVYQYKPSWNPRLDDIGTWSKMVMLLYWYHWLMVMGHWLVMVPVSHGTWLSWNVLINWSCFRVFPDQNAYHLVFPHLHQNTYLHLAEPEDQPWFPRLHSMDRHGSNQCQAITVTNQTKIRPYHHGKFRHHICPDPRWHLLYILVPHIARTSESGNKLPPKPMGQICTTISL